MHLATICQCTPNAAQLPEGTRIRRIPQFPGPILDRRQKCLHAEFLSLNCVPYRRTNCDQLHSPRADQPVRLKRQVDCWMKAETALKSAFNNSPTPSYERRCRVDGPCEHEQRRTPVSPGESKPASSGNSRSSGVAAFLSYGGSRHGRMALVSRAVILERPYVGRRRSCLNSRFGSRNRGNVSFRRACQSV